MTKLRDILVRRIGLTGPISIAEFMLEALSHPDHGYYTTRDPLGAAGDFITAPDISQMFGELVGLALAQAWIEQGRPAPFHLVELGPGRGTLMADLLRATAKIPGFHDAAKIHLVEVSPPLRRAQSDAIRHDLTHHDSLDSVPEGPLFLIANEFFDALPVRQFLRDGPGWRERVIGASDGALSFGLTEPAPVAGLEALLETTPVGALIQTSTPSNAIAAEIGRRIAGAGGLALIIDYGAAQLEGDTLQAVKGHEKTDVLAAPGDADVTAHVDFGALARAAAPAAASGPVPQGVWLERLGITPRAQALAAGLGKDALADHIAAHRRLTHPDEMGTLFKVMALHQSSYTPLSGAFA